MLWNGAGSSIDPGIDYDANWQLLRMTNDGLLDWKRVAGADGNTLVPTSPRRSPSRRDGGKTYTFKLRKGIKFSTGAEVKPSDFKATRSSASSRPPGRRRASTPGIVGGDACAKKPKACDLVQGHRRRRRRHRRSPSS